MLIEGRDPRQLCDGRWRGLIFFMRSVLIFNMSFLQKVQVSEEPKI